MISAAMVVVGGSSGLYQNSVTRPSSPISTQPWSPAAPGRQLVQAIVSDYAGPAAIDGRPRIRGALFSLGFEHTDRVAEIPNSLRLGTEVTLEAVTVARE